MVWCSTVEFFGMISYKYGSGGLKCNNGKLRVLRNKDTPRGQMISNNPNNPSGCIYTKKEVKEYSKIFKKITHKR